MRKPALLFFVYFLLSICAFAQAPAMKMTPPKLFYVHEEVAKPSMVAQYEQTTREGGAMMRDNAQPPFLFEILSGKDFHYYYVVPMSSMADVDKMLQSVAAVAKKMPEKFADLMKRSGVTWDHSNEWVFRRRDDLSYMPENPRVKPDEAMAMRFDWYYIQPGTESDVDGICNAWKAAMAAKKIANGFNIYEAVMGSDLPLVVVETFGKSEADIAAASEQDMMKLGAEAAALNVRTMAGVRHFETRYTAYRNDLSTAPRGSAPANK